MSGKLPALLRVFGTTAFAFSGWVAAWIAYHPEPLVPAASVKMKPAKTAKLRETRNEDLPPEIKDAAPLLADSAFSQLLISLPEIARSARPGEPNEKLLAACRKALTNADFERRRRDFYLLLELMRPEDAAAMHRQFLEMHREGGGLGPEYSAFGHKWGELDAPGALDYMLAEKPFRMPPHDFQYLIRGWGEKDPQAALNWLGEHPDMASAMNGRFALLEGWIRYDPAGATKWMQSANMPQNELIRCVSGGTWQQLYGHGVADAATWLAELPDDHGPMSIAAKIGWNAIQIELGQLSYDQASTAWSRIAGTSWISLEDFTNFGQNISRGTANTEGFPGYLNAVAAKWPADQISQKFEQWTVANPQATLNWLTNAPNSALLKPALEGAIRSLEKTNPEQAALLWKRLGE